MKAGDIVTPKYQKSEYFGQNGTVLRIDETPRKIVCVEFLFEEIEIMFEDELTVVGV